MEEQALMTMKEQALMTMEEQALMTMEEQALLDNGGTGLTLQRRNMPYLTMEE
jgi:hypothetical protein